MRRLLSLFSTLLVLVGIATLAALAPIGAQQADLRAIQQRANELYGAGNYPAALVEAQKLEAAVKARVGTNHVDYAIALNTLARVYEAQGKYAEAETHYQRALAIQEAKLGRDHPDVAVTLNDLANVYQEQDKYAEAEPHLKRVLAIREAKLGRDHPDVAATLNELALLYWAQDEYAEAETQYQRALTILEGRLGRDHPDLVMTFIGLAIAYEKQGKYAEAEAHFKRAVAIREANLGKDHPDVAQALNVLANVYWTQGKYAEAEAHHQRALAIREAKLGRDHRDVAATLRNLALVYLSHGKYAEAEAHHQRALVILEANLGKDHPHVAATLNTLADVYWEQGKYAEAEALYRRALAIDEAKLGKDHPATAKTLDRLAKVYQAQGKHAEAVAQRKAALAIAEAKLGKDHPHVAPSLAGLADVYREQGKYAEAAALYRRALAIYEAKLGKDHPNMATALVLLASVYQTQGKVVEALASVRKASVAVIGHAATEAAGSSQSDAKGLVEQRAASFRRHVAILHAAALQGLEPDTMLAREGFEIAQWAVQSAAAAALAQMAARQAKGTGALAQVVRERQDLDRQWRALDARLNGAVGKGDVVLSAALRSELGGLNVKFAAIDARLAREFPDYAALSNPKPLSVAAAQALLRADEALFVTIDVDVDRLSESFAWLVTKTDTRWVKLALAPKDIADKVQALRCGLDYDGEWGAKDKARAQRCLQLLKLAAVPKEADPVPFDLQVANDLYEGLFGPFKDMIAGKQLLIVPSGALASLPFQVLVTEKPASAFPSDGSYAGVPWLVTRHATSVLPSVTSLKALREHAKASTAGKPYMGIGNPLLLGASGADRSASLKQTCLARPAAPVKVAVRSVPGADARKVAVSGRVDLALLRRQDPLPETADELCEVGRSLRAAPGDILLGSKATERTVKSLSASGALAGYRVLHFATHGLLPQETAKVAADLAEAALLLTPPDAASDEDDGLLTASEVTLLKLNADWVVMSACNTGGGDKSGEALSGLARAFFYAGARALLVSHWYVDSASTVALTTKTFDEMQRDPKLGRAEALRRAMQALIASGGRFAHPANWAPFVVVGEGAAR